MNMMANLSSLILESSMTFMTALFFSFPSFHSHIEQTYGFICFFYSVCYPSKGFLMDSFIVNENFILFYFQLL